VLELIVDQGLVSVKWEPFVIALAGLAYDAVGENHRARRPYNRLLDSASTIPISSMLFESTEMARLFTRSVACYGLRNLKQLRNNLDIALEFSKREAKRRTEEMSDDKLVLLSTLVLLSDYEKVHAKLVAQLGELATKAADLEESAYELDVPQWLSLLLVLLGRSVGSSLAHSILPFPIPDYLKTRLIDQTVVELWPPQLEAANKGLFKGSNIVYATPPGSGKTMLSLLLSGDSNPERKTIYLVPTRTLAEENFGNLAKNVRSQTLQVGISTRDRTEFDDILDQLSVIVTTYEKFNPLVRSGRIDSTKISRILVDEVQKLSDEGRGIPLEFILTKYRSLPSSEDPQLVTISGIIRKDDAERLSAWLNSTLVSTDWRPVELDETILCRNLLHHKDGSVERITVSSSSQAGSRAQRSQIAVQLVRRALVAGGQSLIAIESRRKVEEFAELLRDSFSTSQFDLDLQRELKNSGDVPNFTGKIATK